MKKILRESILKLSVILLVSVLVGCSQEKMVLKNDKLTIEYGKTISMDTNDYLDNQEKFLKDVKIEVDGENEKGKSYFPIGEYKVVLTHGEDICTVVVEIKDTVSPEFVNLKDSYRVEFGKKFDVKQIETKDLSNVKVSIDDSQVNYKKSGTYTATIAAKDESSNETSHKIKIEVKEEVKKETKGTTSSSQSASTKKNSSSSDGSSSSSQSQKSSSNGGSGSLKEGQVLESERDENSYTEFRDGNNVSWGGSIRLPEDYFD